MNIHDEILEMFSELNEIDLRFPQSKNLTYALLREMKCGINSSKIVYAQTDSLLRLHNSELILTRSRFDSFYKRAGQIVVAFELLRSGLYSLREVCKVVNISTNTGQRILNKIPTIKCVCGRTLKGHTGWCSHRFYKSIKRQSFISEWGKYKSHGK